MKIFFLLIPFLLWDAKSWGTEDYKTELQKVKKELEIRKKEEKELIWKEKSILDGLRKVDNQISSSKKKIKKLKTKEKIFKDLIKTLDLRKEELLSQLDKYKNLIDENFILMYEYGISNQSPQINPTQARTVFYMEEILEEDVSRYDKLLGLKTNITTKKDEEQEGLSKLQEIKKKAEKEQKEVFSQQRKKRSILKDIRKEKGKKSKLIAELENSRTELEKLIAGVKKYPAREFGATIWPVQGEIVSRFGTIIDPELGTKLINEGIDIRAPYGTDVVAVSDGEVAYEGTFLGYGEMILLDHQNGFCSLYAYLSETLVVKEDKVKKGEAIGRVGSTGLVDRPTLHFEIRKNGVAVNPLEWLK